MMVNAFDPYLPTDSAFMDWDRFNADKRLRCICIYNLKLRIQSWNVQKDAISPETK